MSTLERAFEIATRHHEGQVDKGGQPYILRPLRVVLSVPTSNERMAAVLHDFVEDTPMTRIGAAFVSIAISASAALRRPQASSTAKLFSRSARPGIKQC